MATEEEEEEEDWEAYEDDYEVGQGEGVYKHKCRRAVEKIFQKELGCTEDEAKAYGANIETKVKHMSWEDQDDVRTVECEATFRSFETGSKEALTLDFQYHHRTRFYSVEHSSFMTSKLHSQTGKKFLFKSSVKDLSRYHLKHEPTIENRKFCMSQASLKAIKRSIFKGFLPGKLTDIAIVHLLYASVGVQVDGAAMYVCMRSGWLDHYTNALCGVPPESEDEDGYVTEDPEEEIRKHMRMEHDEADSDDGDGAEGYSSDW